MVTVGPDIAFMARSPRARGRYIQNAEEVARASAEAEHRRAEVGLLHRTAEFRLKEVRRLQVEVRDALERFVGWLEFYCASAMVLEIMHERKLRTRDDLQRVPDLDRHVFSVFSDVPNAPTRIRRVLDDLPDEGTSRDLGDIDWSQFVRSFNAIVAECPIDSIEKIAQDDEPALVHAARNAYDALRAFVRRHDPECAEVARIVGEQYRHGHLTMHDAARLMGMSTSDAVFELQQNGYARSQSAIALTEEQRAEAFERMRRRRLEGRVEVDPQLVDRDVIASERIEGVDARAWIRRG